MNTLPSEFIDEKETCISQMPDGIEFPTHYDDLRLDQEDHLWIRRDIILTQELDNWQHEDEMVYVKRNVLHDSLTVRIPSTFSKRRKWSRYDLMDPKEWKCIAEIIVG